MVGDLASRAVGRVVGSEGQIAGRVSDDEDVGAESRDAVAVRAAMALSNHTLDSQGQWF